MPTGKNAHDLLAKPLPQKKYDSYLLAKGIRYKGIVFSTSGSLLVKCFKGNRT